MKAMRLAGAAPLLIEADIPRPELHPGEVLVRVYAAGLTTAELDWYPTSHTKTGSPRIGAVPSHEFSGTVAQIGGGIQSLSIGQEIYGMNDWFADGALAEYCATRADWIAPKPASLSHIEAASVPIDALTAWQGLFDRAKIQPGERVLIHGGAGAVGVFAIQLARWRGARVVTTVSAGNAAFVQELGADQVIDYQAVRFEEEARDLDVVFDTVGGDTLRRSWSVLKPDGRLVTITSDSDSLSEERAKHAFLLVEPNQRQLIEITRLLDARAIRTVIDTVLPLSRAADAYAGKVQRKGRGKLVVAVESES